MCGVPYLSCPSLTTLSYSSTTLPLSRIFFLSQSVKEPSQSFHFRSPSFGKSFLRCIVWVGLRCKDNTFLLYAPNKIIKIYSFLTIIIIDMHYFYRN